jgi:hypothetical protein
MITIKQSYAKLLFVTLMMAFVTNGWGQQILPLLHHTFYVSVNGNDHNNGTTPFSAFRKIQTGIDHLQGPGDVLRIMAGRYTEFVLVKKKKGSAFWPIIIEGWPGNNDGSATIIQGSITKLVSSNEVFNFHKKPNDEWEHVVGDDAHQDEYVSKKTFPLPPNRTNEHWHVSRGAFVNPVNSRYTRLITYSRIEDLRADNETFEQLYEGTALPCIIPRHDPPNCTAPDPRPGPILGDSCGCTIRRPWVYMGPGIWFDTATKKIHIRLSPTHNGVTGLADYNGNTDPNQLALSISEETMTTLTVQGSNHIQFKNLSVRFGGRTIEVINSRSVLFDNVTIWAGQYGAMTGDTVNKLRFTNSVFDGGLPTWMFRTDLKDDYAFLRNGDTIQNNLGKNTMETLFLGNAQNDSAEIDHCEFINAHDLYLNGTNFNFHHNWISNLHDEGMFLDANTNTSGRVHHNVMVQVLSAISFAGEHIADHWYIYRNLVDLRNPTAGYRPKNNTTFDRSRVWRGGMPFKSNGVDGPFDVFQNTFIVPFLKGEKNDHPFNQLRTGTITTYTRRSINNIFIVVNHYDTVPPDPGMAFLPPIGFPADIRGNLYYLRGRGKNVFYIPNAQMSGFLHFTCETGEDCTQKWRESSFFLSSGFEANSILFRDPQFMSWAMQPATIDNFRLKTTSPARHAGVQLPPDLKLLDNQPLLLTNPDIGCYQASQIITGIDPQLKVGVHGRRHYPAD